MILTSIWNTVGLELETRRIDVVLFFILTFVYSCDRISDSKAPNVFGIIECTDKSCFENTESVESLGVDVYGQKIYVRENNGHLEKYYIEKGKVTYVEIEIDKDILFETQASLNAYLLNFYGLVPVDTVSRYLISFQNQETKETFDVHTIEDNRRVGFLSKRIAEAPK